VRHPARNEDLAQAGPHPRSLKTRCPGPRGNFRAMILGGSRADALRRLRVPTLVIHGLDDTLIDPSGGKRTADLVPGARLLLLPGMGHDRPRELWREIIDALDTHTR
ncbi:alpha/beta fold hydrolase, partial [Streptomyces sp. NPDC056227]|uniref:alpha/beta fold hydrolase n=1 Tax=Streptomyces sp. NPDC056227 TaxID=3345753 RepID=UPI0035D9BDCE